MIANLTCKQIILAYVQVTRNNREIDRVDELGQLAGTVIKFVVTHCHDVKTDRIHELSFNGTFVGSVHQRALKLVTRIDNDHILARSGQAIAQFVDLGRNARNPTEALAFGIIFSAASRVETIDWFDPAVQVIDMNNVKGVVGLSHARGKSGGYGKRGRRRQQT